MSRYMSMREMSELSEIVRELRDSGEITDERPESEMTFSREAPEPLPFQEDFEDDGEF